MHCAFASPGHDAALQNLSSILNAGVLFESLKRRVADLRKNVKGETLPPDFHFERPVPAFLHGTKPRSQ